MLLLLLRVSLAAPAAAAPGPVSDCCSRARDCQRLLLLLLRASLSAPTASAAAASAAAAREPVSA